MNATGKYKFSSVELNIAPLKQVINRQTYDFLSWLSDCGGLTDACLRIGKLVLKPFTSFNLGSFLLTTLFRVIPTSENKTYKSDYRE